MTDGVNSGSAETGPFVVENKPPQVAILTPVDRTVVETEGVVELAGSALDLEDGFVEETRLVWTSNRAGRLGAGGSVKAQLAPGRHEIKLTASDADGRSAAATIIIRVRKTPPK